MPGAEGGHVGTAVLGGFGDQQLHVWYVPSGSPVGPCCLTCRHTEGHDEKGTRMAVAFQQCISNFQTTFMKNEAFC